MADSLFTVETPSNSDVNDGVEQTLGTVWESDAAGSVTHGRWRFPDTPAGGSVDWVLYTIGGTEVARATFASVVPGDWNQVALGTPYTYSTPGTRMVAAVVTPDRYVATNSFFNVSDLVSGHLTAPATGNVSGGNGRFVNGDAFPTGTFSGGCYFVDLVFTTEAPSQNIDVAFIAATGTVYQPALTPGPVSVAVAFISSATTVYQPSLSPGPVNVTVPLIASTLTVYQPAIASTSSQSISVAFIASTLVVKGIRITGGSRMAPLIPVSDLETLLGRTFTDAEAAQAALYIDYASTYIRDYTDRSFERRSNHQIRSQADAHGVIELPDPPIVTVTSVVDADDEGESWDVDVVWDQMWRLNRLRPWHTYDIVYTHGDVEVPDSIKGICASMASRQMINPAGIRQETVGATSVTYASVFGEAGALGLSKLERQILDRYADVAQSWRV